MDPSRCPLAPQGWRPDLAGAGPASVTAHLFPQLTPMKTSFHASGCVFASVPQGLT